MQFNLTSKWPAAVIPRRLALTEIFAPAYPVRQGTEIEAMMNSVERMMHYSHNIPEEAPEVIEDHRPPEGWPSEGGISVRGLGLRYREDRDLVLRDVSVEIRPREKIGIVGRTGAGKVGDSSSGFISLHGPDISCCQSSFVAALLRLVEPCAGEVVVDGVRTASLGLQDLRSKIAVIPQDPFLFSGTVRFVSRS